MKKFVKQNLLTTFILYVLIYFIKTFVTWEFNNPFQWIIDMPKYEAESRGSILIIYIFYQIVLLGIFTGNKKDETIS